MSPEAQRIALAGACPQIRVDELGDWYWIDDQGRAHDCLDNDPLLDLHVLQAAEKMLTTWEIREQYVLKLNLITQGWDHPLYTLASATADQRAEAFLRALKLWTDEPAAAQRKDGKGEE